MPKVSIIVPVHNPGKYLTPLIESLINQTLKDIEIFLIDDGSTDGSRGILKEYENKDSRITSIFRDKQPNEHFSEKYSIDLGRSLATGEYIMFIDHDDELDLQALEILYSYTLNGNIDVVQARSISITENGKQTYATPNFFPEPFLITNWMDLNELTLFHHLVIAPIALWICLIRNDFQKDIELDDCVYNDVSFIWKIKMLAKSFLYIPQYLYKQNSHESSLSHQTNENCFEIFIAFNHLEKFLKEKQIDSSIWYTYSLYEFAIFMTQIVGVTDPNIMIEFKKEQAKVLQNNCNITLSLIDSDEEIRQIYQELIS